ncbi:hypothetical protein JCM16307_14870 [Thermococcus prieurii]
MANQKENHSRFSISEGATNFDETLQQPLGKAGEQALRKLDQKKVPYLTNGQKDSCALIKARF